MATIESPTPAISTFPTATAPQATGTSVNCATRSGATAGVEARRCALPRALTIDSSTSCDAPPIVTVPSLPNPFMQWDAVPVACGSPYSAVRLSVGPPGGPPFEVLNLTNSNGSHANGSHANGSHANGSRSHANGLTETGRGSQVSQTGSSEVREAYAHRTATRSAGRYSPEGRHTDRGARSHRSPSPIPRASGRRWEDGRRERSRDRRSLARGTERGKELAANDSGVTGADRTWVVRDLFSLLKRLVYSHYLRPGCSVCDFGHGPGTDLHKFAHAKIGSLVAVDFVSEALDEARFRAKTIPKFKKYVQDVQFIQQDLCRVVCKISPEVDVVTCQFAMHYMWANDSTIDTFLTSVSGSLKSKGHFIATIVDANKIPANGITDHPFIHITPPKQAATPTAADVAPKEDKDGKTGAASSNWAAGRWSYRFTFPGLVRDLEEFVIPAEELLRKCRQFSLELVASYSVRDRFADLLALRRNEPPELSNAHWTALDLYRSYVFQKV